MIAIIVDVNRPHVYNASSKASPCATRFDVALWREWFTENNIPDVIASVYAPNAFSAIAGLMRACHFESITRTAAYRDDRTLIYLAHQVQLRRLEEGMSQVRE